MKFLGGLSGSNRFICCKIFKPLIPNVHYKYQKEGYSVFFLKHIGPLFHRASPMNTFLRDKFENLSYTEGFVVIKALSLKSFIIGARQTLLWIF